MPDTYDEWRAQYEGVEHVPPYMDLLNETVAQAGIQDGDRVLEVGIGLGGLTRQLIHKMACYITAIDSEPDAIQRFERYLQELTSYRSSVHLQVANALKLPFEAESFDKGASTLTLHHLDPAANKVAALQEFHRVLRDGGKLAIGEILIDFHDKLDDAWRQRVETVWSGIIEMVGQISPDIAQFEEQIMLPRVLEREGEYMVGGDQWVEFFIKAGFRDTTWKYVHEHLGYGVVVGTK